MRTTKYLGGSFLSLNFVCILTEQTSAVTDLIVWGHPLRRLHFLSWRRSAEQLRQLFNSPRSQWRVERIHLIPMLGLPIITVGLGRYREPATDLD